MNLTKLNISVNKFDAGKIFCDDLATASNFFVEGACMGKTPKLVRVPAFQSH